MIGLPVSKTQLNDKVGQLALTLKKAFDDAVSINNFLLQTPDATLVSLGFEQTDVTILKTALADLAYMKVTAFDASPSVKQLWGLGV